MLYRAPEILRLGTDASGTPKGDVYSFGIILYEIHTRHGPFGDTGISVMDCLKKVLQQSDFSEPFRYDWSLLIDMIEFSVLRHDLIVDVFFDITDHLYNHLIHHSTVCVNV